MTVESGFAINDAFTGMNDAYLAHSLNSCHISSLSLSKKRTKAMWHYATAFSAT
jgi:hypothetical protein